MPWISGKPASPRHAKPAINATAAMILGLTLAAIVIAYLVLRRSGEGERGAGVPGV